MAECEACQGKKWVVKASFDPLKRQGKMRAQACEVCGPHAPEVTARIAPLIDAFNEFAAYWFGAGLPFQSCGANHIAIANLYMALGRKEAPLRPILLVAPAWHLDTAASLCLSMASQGKIPAISTIWPDPDLVCAQVEVLARNASDNIPAMLLRKMGDYWDDEHGCLRQIPFGDASAWLQGRPGGPLVVLVIPEMADALQAHDSYFRNAMRVDLWREP